MLVSIGQRSGDPDDVVGLLLECHARIRAFAKLAVTVGTEEGATAEELAVASQRVHRYFTEALPLHVRDEEESLLPRLRGRDAAVDAALGVMHDEHADHLAGLARLVSLADALTRTPLDAELRAAMGEVGSELSAAFEAHLSNEETRIFPAIAALLSKDEQQAAVTELRARRRS